MGILRADRVSGLGGANAINGSVFFGTSAETTRNRGLIVNNTSELDIGTGNFTIEYWFNTSQTSATGYAGTGVSTWEYTSSSSNTAFTIYHFYKGIRIFNRISSGFTKILDNASNWSTDTWHHFAWVREGTGSSENKAYIDGTLIGSAFTNAADYTTGQDWLIGANNYQGFPNYGFSGYISNLRVSNVARYTANFTAPTTRFEKDADTIILACQSPGNVLQEATGKIITDGSDTGNDYGLAVASRFSPDLGEDYGTTFEDNTKFDTLSYMVPPGGTTAQSNRGRGIYGLGGFPSYVNSIDFLAIQSTGNAQDFGDLTITKAFMAAAGNQTRSVFSRSYNGSGSNVMDFVTIATTSNALDFGDATTTAWAPAGCGNNTRGLFGGGAPAINILEYITFATAGNATDFGDLYSKRDMGGLSNSTRVVFAGGGDSPQVDTIEYVTIATTGNGTDFGNLTAATQGLTGSSNSTRGIFAGGYTPTVQNTIQYITIASTGDAVDFGDLTFTSFRGASCSSPTRSVIMQGFSPSGQVNSIDFITISTTGNASDFGDKTAASSQMSESGTSDCHGGIS